MRTHMHKLITMEYVLVHRGSRGQTFVYELLYDGGGRDGRPFMMGLIDPAALKLQHNDEHRSGDNEHRDGENEAATSPQRAANEEAASAAENATNSSRSKQLPRTRRYKLRNAHEGNGRDGAASYAVPAGKG